jgi:hypothetical protein
VHVDEKPVTWLKTGASIPASRRNPFTYSNQFPVYTRDQAKDNEGRTLPVTGKHSVILDMNTTVWHEMLSETAPAVRGETLEHATDGDGGLSKQ